MAKSGQNRVQLGMGVAAQLTPIATAPSVVRAGDERCMTDTEALDQQLCVPAKAAGEHPNRYARIV
jgi:hypothetical protein